MCLYVVCVVTRQSVGSMYCIDRNKKGTSVFVNAVRCSRRELKGMDVVEDW
jgi:hypothetical protein